MPRDTGPNWMHVYAGLPVEWREVIDNCANALVMGAKAHNPMLQFSRGSAIQAATALLWKVVMSSE